MSPFLKTILHSLIPPRTGAALARGKSKQDYPTPWSLIHACCRRFGKIAVDLAASPGNAKAANYFTKEDDSLSINWVDYIPADQWGWLNPPFDNITPWAKKCADQSRLGAKILFLTPASVGANWYRDHVHKKASVKALNGRITFEGAADPYPKDCILSVYGAREFEIFDVWKWQDESDENFF